MRSEMTHSGRGAAHVCRCVKTVPHTRQAAGAHHHICLDCQALKADLHLRRLDAHPAVTSELAYAGSRPAAVLDTCMPFCKLRP